MTTTFIEKTPLELQELSRRGRNEYASELERRATFERWRDLAASMATSKPVNEQRLKESGELVRTLLAKSTKIEKDLADVLEQLRNARAAHDVAVRESQGGWVRNQLLILADPAIADGLATLKEQWDDARHSASAFGTPKKLARVTATIERLQQGMAEIEALKFDPTIATVEELEQRVQEIVFEHTGPNSERQ